MQRRQPLFDTFSQKLAELLKGSPAKDIEANLRAGLGSLLGKLDLVTREEFDIQAEVLQRTKAQLAALEARLNELEARDSTTLTQD
ncbi:MAG: accessory factor UbiK family protein [Thiobacillaceae bacterium]